MTRIWFALLALLAALPASAQYTSTPIATGIVADCADGADINNDGHTDIVQTGNSTSDVVWLDYLGTPTWEAHVIHQVTGSETQCSARDMDLDGDIDIIVADDNGGSQATVEWLDNPCNPTAYYNGCVGDPTGTWTVRHTIHTGGTSEPSPGVHQGPSQLECASAHGSPRSGLVRVSRPPSVAGQPQARQMSSPLTANFLHPGPLPNTADLVVKPAPAPVGPPLAVRVPTRYQGLPKFDT